ncbi:hypothetical protein QWA68_006048 [Fusarium oxysporum]|nr:hypothetical protein QWA68_006048 [Fusarium oxysporum]
MTRWNSLLQEIRGMILGYIVIHDRIAPYAPVSIEWRDAIEKTFRHLRIQASSSDACGRTPTVFESLSRLCGRHRRLVKHIWLNIELTKHPKWWDSGYNLSSEDRAIGVAVKRLFQAVESWPAQNDLTLEINVYEPMSYSEEWLKGHHYEGPGEQDEDMRRLSTSEPRDLATAPRNALECLFDRLDFDMPSTPSVQAVTKFLLPAGVNFQQKLCLACSDDFPGWKRLSLRLRISRIFIMDSLMVTDMHNTCLRHLILSITSNR